MSNAEQNPLDWHRRFAAMELRISKIEGRLDDVDRVIEPDGWIGEAFKVLETHMDQKFSEVDQRFNSMDQRFDSIDAKLDIIMRHITGLNQDS
jgi:tetrahydromethanopterin S-methyltransferase subunit G